MTDAGFPGLEHSDPPEGGGYRPKAGTFARNMSAGRRFMIRPEFMRVPSVTDGAAPGVAGEPVTLSRRGRRRGIRLCIVRAHPRFIRAGLTHFQSSPGRGRSRRDEVEKCWGEMGERWRVRTGRVG